MHIVSFVNGEKKVKPILISRIQDRRGKTIYNSEKRNCKHCDILNVQNEALPEILQMMRIK